MVIAKNSTVALKSGYIVKKVRKNELQIFEFPSVASKKNSKLRNFSKFVGLKTLNSTYLPIVTGFAISLSCLTISNHLFTGKFNSNNQIEISYNDYAERFKINEPIRISSKEIESSNKQIAINQQQIPQVALPVSYNPSERNLAIQNLKASYEKPTYTNTSLIEKKVYNIIKRFTKNQEAGMRLASRIVIESKKNNYDPLFVAAVIKSESGFNTFATSHVGAKGLMQIMPDTGRFVEKLKDFGPRPAGFLTDPQYNLKLGISYLKHLEEMYDGNKVLTLMAYNWGPGKVNNTVKGKNRGVPVEVMNYALKILHDHNNWRKELVVEG